jgi:hypothetical protein
MYTYGGKFYLKCRGIKRDIKPDVLEKDKKETANQQEGKK